MFDPWMRKIPWRRKWQLTPVFLPGESHGLGDSDGKESACNAGDPGSVSGSGRSPAEGNGNPLQHSCLENPMDRGAWWGYSPWGRKESDTCEQLSTHSQKLFAFSLIRETLRSLF